MRVDRKTIYLVLLTVFFALAHGAEVTGQEVAAKPFKFEPVQNVNLGPVEIHGFASQGMLFTGNQNYPTQNSRSGDFRFTDLGLNGNYNILPNLRLGMQVTSLALGKYGEMVPDLDWAVIDYQANPYFGVRAGRVKVPIGLYNESSDVDAARTFIFQPIGFYDPRYRTLVNSLDGGSFYGNIPLSETLGSVDYLFFMGQKGIDNRGYFTDAFCSTTPLVSEHVDANYESGFDVTYNTPFKGLRLNASYLRVEDFTVQGRAKTFDQIQRSASPSVIASVNAVGQAAWDAGVANTPASINASSFNVFTFGAEYLYDKWTFAGEFQRFEGVLNVTAAGRQSYQDQRRQSWYVSACYRLNDWYSCGVYFNQSVKDYQDLNGSKQAAAIGGSGSWYYANDLALTSRFDLTTNWILKIEGHYIDGTSYLENSSGQNPNYSSARNPGWYLLAVRTTFNF